ncbi:hypothetical protein AB1Y20_006888 [Prymnesium parvum]|uniref:Uncharacterized protein n=1 Tax=Prymnesium parvum TaxID=97485 RepID=A0AB34IZM0_PRYPA
MSRGVMLTLLWLAAAAAWHALPPPRAPPASRCPSPIMQRGAPRPPSRGGAPRGRGRAVRSVRYISEAEMEAHVLQAARRMEFDEDQARMVGACGRNIYALGCGYHPTTHTILEEICEANEAEAWAVLLRGCLRGTMSRLRSEATASARMDAARAAAARRRSSAPPRPGG